MKTRDTYEILKEIKAKGYFFDTAIFHKPEKLIESMVELLSVKENVVDFIGLPGCAISTFLLVTDSGKLIGSNITTTVSRGFVFDKTKQDYDIVFLSIDGFRPDSVEVYEEKGAGAFGGTMDRVYVGFDDGTLNFLAKRGKGMECYKKEFLAKIKKRLPKPEKPAAKTPAAKKAAPVKAASTEGDASAIAEIRKMYDDGIISKEEMMELLKLQLKK